MSTQSTQWLSGILGGLASTVGKFIQPIVGAAIAPFKSLLKTASGIMYAAFGILFLFVLVGAYCGLKPDPVPKVDVIQAEKKESVITQEIVSNLDDTVRENKKTNTVTEDKAETTKKTLDKKTKEIESQPLVSNELKRQQLGGAQIDALNHLYNEYYGTSG